MALGACAYSCANVDSGRSFSVCSARVGDRTVCHWTDMNFTDEQKSEIKEIVTEAMSEYFLSKGKTWKSYIITVATIVGAFTVIFGGLKMILASLGFTIINNR